MCFKNTKSKKKWKKTFKFHVSLTLLWKSSTVQPFREKAQRFSPLVKKLNGIVNKRSEVYCKFSNYLISYKIPNSGHKSLFGLIFMLFWIFHGVTKSMGKKSIRKVVVSIFFFDRTTRFFPVTIPIKLIDFCRGLKPAPKDLYIFLVSRWFFTLDSLRFSWTFWKLGRLCDVPGFEELSLCDLTRIRPNFNFNAAKIAEVGQKWKVKNFRKRNKKLKFWVIEALKIDI